MNLRKRTRAAFEGANYMKEMTNQYEIEWQLTQFNSTKMRKINGSGKPMFSQQSRKAYPKAN